jgi:hypothetical protein
MEYYFLSFGDFVALVQFMLNGNVDTFLYEIHTGGE